MEQSRLRRETCAAKPGTPSPQNGTAYLMILNAVEAQDGLIAGKLHDHGAHCAIGSYFHINPETALSFELIDEVAMVNDSMPMQTPRQRKIRVARWLRWKLAQVGMPGFAKAKRP